MILARSQRRRIQLCLPLHKVETGDLGLDRGGQVPGGATRGCSRPGDAAGPQQTQTEAVVIPLLPCEAPSVWRDLLAQNRV